MCNFSVFNAKPGRFHSNHIIKILQILNRVFKTLSNIWDGTYENRCTKS